MVSFDTHGEKLILPSIGMKRKNYDSRKIYGHLTILDPSSIYIINIVRRIEEKFITIWI